MAYEPHPAMETREIGQLKPHPLNAEIYGDGCSAELRDIIATHGVKPEYALLITGYAAYCGPGVIISGHRRFNAAHMAGLDTVPVMVSDAVTQEDIEELLVLGNVGSRERTTEQKAREYKALKRVEEARAKLRSLQNLKQNTEVENFPPRMPEGKSRDLAAEKVGLGSGKTADKAAQVVDIIDTAKSTGNAEYAKELTSTLNNSVDGAYKEVKPIIQVTKQVEREVRAQTVLTTEDEIQKRIDAESKRRAKEQFDALVEKKKQQKEGKRRQAEKAREDLLKRVEQEREERPAHEKVLPSLLLVDPPWQYRHCATNNRKIENHYETAQHDDLVTHLPETQENCVLFMWVTAPKIAEGIDLVRAWGFDYRTCAVWDKEKIGMGYWFRGEHEILFVAVKGKVSPPQPSERVSSMFRETRTEHSKKPECVYEWIEKAFAEHEKLEMYCRKPREGWQVWGNEV